MEGREVPVIASNLGALPEIIEHGKNGFLVSAPSSWISYLETLRNPNIYKQISQNAFTDARNFFQTKMHKVLEE
jgi:glycosyltransferase involved in cell wall biosynthesis